MNHLVWLHIITSNLRVIKNNLLRKLFTKGPKFRESKPINFDKHNFAFLLAWKNASKNGVNKNVFP